MTVNVIRIKCVCVCVFRPDLKKKSSTMLFQKSWKLHYICCILFPHNSAAGRLCRLCRGEVIKAGNQQIVQYHIKNKVFIADIN